MTNAPHRQVAELIAISHIDNAAFALEAAARDESQAARLHAAGDIEAETRLRLHARRERELAQGEAGQFLSYCLQRQA